MARNWRWQVPLPFAWPHLLPLVLFLFLMPIGVAGAADGYALPARRAPGVPKTDAYGFYTNHKYGYAIAWPKRLLTATGESAAGDGQLFRSPDGQTELRCWAWFNSVIPDSLQVLYRKAQRQSGLAVTYNHLGKNSFVVSGFRGRMIVYKKTIISGETTATFVLTYPKAHSAVFNPVVGDIAKSFVVHPAFMTR